VQKSVNGTNSTAARNALQELKRLYENGVEWKELIETYFPGGMLSENTLRAYVRDKRHFAGTRDRTVAIFANAWTLMQRRQCVTCNFYEMIGHRLQVASVASPLRLPAQYFGEYLSFNRLLAPKDYYSAQEKNHKLALHHAAIRQCAICGRPVFRVEQKQSKKWREGAVFHCEDRIHIIVIDPKYMPHAVVRPVSDLDLKPLSGIALFDEEDAAPNVSARRIAFVKQGTTLANARDLWSRMDRILVSDKPTLDGAIAGWAIE
jgi:hypothetical protein